MERKDMPLDHDSEEHVVEGEIVAEHSDGTMVNLPRVPEKSGAKTDIPDYENSRRSFILRIALGGIAALAAGGSASLLYTQRQRRTQQPEVVIPPGTDLSGADTTVLVQRVADLEYDLAAALAERDQALSDLNRANTETDGLRERLEAALAEIDELQEINGLWEALDEIGVDDLLAGALAAVRDSLRGVFAVLGLLQSGIAQGQSAIDRFLRALPSPQEGIEWLGERVASLSDDLEWLSDQVDEVVEPVGTLAAMVSDFVIWVLDRLPFGIGEQARAGLEAMSSIINGLPEFVSGILESVLDPLGEWFGSDSDVSLLGILIDPIEEKVIEPARDVLAKFTDFEADYTDTLETPTESALEQRAEIRQQLEQAQARRATRLSS